MKEATGELSTTVIAIVAIAAVLTLFTTVFLPMIRNSITGKMNCNNAYGCTNCDGRTCECLYDTYNDDGTINQQGLNITCDDPNKQ